MTVDTSSSVSETKLDMVEHKLDRLIDEMRFLKSRTIAFDTRLRAIEAYLKPSEPSEQQPDSKFTPWLAAAASATARTALFAIAAPAAVIRMPAPRRGVVRTSVAPVLAGRSFCDFSEAVTGCGTSSVVAVVVGAVSCGSFYRI